MFIINDPGIAAIPRRDGVHVISGWVVCCRVGVGNRSNEPELDARNPHLLSKLSPKRVREALGLFDMPTWKTP